MKTGSLFLAFCVAMATAQIRMPSDFGEVFKLAGQIGVNIAARVALGATFAVAEKFGIEPENFAAVLKKFGELGAKGRGELLDALSIDFLTKFQDSPMLKDKSVADIAKDYRSNINNLLSGVTRNGLPSHELTALNEVQGLNAQEYQSLMGTFPSNRNAGGPTRGRNVGSSRGRRQALPQSVDWREKGAITPVKNQGKCGSCWAFSAIGALEGRIGVKTGSPPVLSEQNLMDCAKNVNGSKCCAGCGGGSMLAAYTYVQQNPGVATNASYPYEEKDGVSCRYPTAEKGGDVIGYEFTKQGDEKDLMRAVAEGPVAIAVSAQTWSSYKKGVFKCSTILAKIPIFGKILDPKKDANHGVVLVGYGTSSEGDYWIVKNSWGASWGENGYLRIARGNNECGIADDAIYPIV